MTVQAHNDLVEKALLLTDGKIITVGLDGIIKSLDAFKDSKKPLNMLGGHTSGVTDVI